MNSRFFIAAILALGCASGSYIAIAAPAVGKGAPAQNICTRLEYVIDGAEKDASAAEADEIGEDSAIRATVDQGKITTAYLEIQANLILMEQHHCAPLDHPVMGDYLLAATDCHTDMLKSAISGSSDLPPSCDQSKWKRDFQ